MINLIRIATILLGIFSCAAHAETLKIRIATEGAYPPFNFIDKSGQLAGFDVDIAKALCASMQAECSFVAVPWADIIPGVLDNKYDLIVASMAFTEERAKLIAFSEPYYRSHSNFIGNPAVITAITPDALKGKKIVAGEATIQAEYLKKIYPGSELIFTKDQPDAYKLLVEGNADLLFADAMDLLAFLESPDGSRFDYIGDAVSSDFLQSTSHITARKDEAALIEKVNAAIKQIRLDGTYDRINQAYFPFSIY